MTRPKSTTEQVQKARENATYIERLKSTEPDHAKVPNALPLIYSQHYMIVDHCDRGLKIYDMNRKIKTITPEPTMHDE